MSDATMSQPMTESQLAAIEAMFVQLAGGFSTTDHTITFHDLSPATLFFADRPQRAVGHISSARFVSEWGDGDNSFADDPPNAVLSFIETGDKVPEEATIVIRNPQMNGNKLTYTVDVLEGTLPATAGPCSLFIDPIGRPLSPVSVAGVRRRDRRQDRRGR